MSYRLIEGHVLTALRTLPDNSVHCVWTSPPYWGLRSYQTEPQIWGGDPSCAHDWQYEYGRVTGGGERPKDNKWKSGPLIDSYSPRATCTQCRAWLGELGQEKTPQDFVRHLVLICEEVKRVLHPSGIFWLNMGESSIGGKGRSGAKGSAHQEDRYRRGKSINRGYQTLGGAGVAKPTDDREMLKLSGLKPKDLALVPFRLAIALQDAGWWVRRTIIWAKGISFNPHWSGGNMPSSVQDAPTISHEYLFMLTKRAHYFYDRWSCLEPLATANARGIPFGGKKQVSKNGNRTYNGRIYDASTLAGRNLRSVWTINTSPSNIQHYAIAPEALIEPCVKLSTSSHGVCPFCRAPYRRVTERQDNGKERDSASTENSGVWVTTGWETTCQCKGGEPTPATVMDIFSGTGTTGVVAAKLGRHYIGIELNAEYNVIANKRIAEASAQLALLPSL